MAVIHDMPDSDNARWYMMLAGLITAGIVSTVLLVVTALRHRNCGYKKNGRSDSSILSSAFKKSYRTSSSKSTIKKSVSYQGSTTSSTSSVGRHIKPIGNRKISCPAENICQKKTSDFGRPPVCDVSHHHQQQHQQHHPHHGQSQLSGDLKTNNCGLDQSGSCMDKSTIKDEKSLTLALEPKTATVVEEEEQGDQMTNDKCVGKLKFCVSFDDSGERPALTVTILNASCLRTPTSGKDGQSCLPGTSSSASSSSSSAPMSANVASTLSSSTSSVVAATCGQQSTAHPGSGAKQQQQQQQLADPYVKLQLLPERKHKVKTRVVRHTRNPVYDETFTFYDVTCDQLSSISLCFTVLSFDRFSQDQTIGQTSYSLAAVHLDDLRCGLRLTEDVVKCDTVSTSPVQGNRGDLLVSLCYQPAANRVVVVVLKARGLPKMDLTGLSDPYVKIYLMYKGKRIAKKKTRVKKRTLDPVFNESFQFDMPMPTSPDHAPDTPSSGGDTSSTLSEPKSESFEHSLADVSLEFLVTDWDRVTKNEVVGKLKLGAGADSTSAQRHWHELLHSPRKQLAEWHSLTE